MKSAALVNFQDREIHALLAGRGIRNLDTYIQTVNRIPMLASEEEEFALARALQQQGDLLSAQKLILSHLRLVVSIARQYLGYGLPHADLIQEGNIGLMKAVKRFDPRHGVRLVSYAIHWIKAEIHEYILRNWRVVRIATTKAQRKLFFNLRSQKSKLSRLNPDEIHEIAVKFKVKPEEVADMESRFAQQEVALETPQNDDTPNTDPITYLSDTKNEPLALLHAKAHDTLQGEGLQHALSRLDARSRRIIEARWLANTDNQSTLQALADELGISAERVRQIETVALKKMRASLQIYT